MKFIHISYHSDMQTYYMTTRPDRKDIRPFFAIDTMIDYMRHEPEIFKRKHTHIFIDTLDEKIRSELERKISRLPFKKPVFEYGEPRPEKEYLNKMIQKNSPHQSSQNDDYSK